MFKTRAGSIIASLLTLALSALLFANSYPEYQRLGSAPQRLTVFQAIEQVDRKPWVQLTDARWHCDRPMKSIRQNSTAIQLSDPDDKNIIITDYSGSVNCREKSLAAPIGTLSKMSEKTIGHFLRDGSLKSEQEQVSKRNVYWMCMYCGRTNSQMGVILAVVFAVIAALFYYITETVRKISKRPDPFTAKPWDAMIAGFFLILLGVITIAFTSNHLFFYFLPGVLLGLLMCLGGLTIAAFSRNKSLLRYLTKVNRKTAIDIWGEDYFADRSLPCRNCKTMCNIVRDECHNCGAKL